MNIDKDTVVQFHYSLSDADGPIESSAGNDPLTILVGHGQLIPGVENALHGHAAGDKFAVTVTPEEGYGERREEMVQRVPKKYFHQAERLKPGMQTVLQVKDGGQRVVTVLKVGQSVIDVDLNHPMAGKTLQFEIEVVDVRAASEEEIAHGHAHGPGGHHH
jgi:FKBP-type peptidyl-prolyl cis-trans isomerase SlyD